MSLPLIDSIKCTGCGKCEKVCPARCIVVSGYAQVAKPEKCISCGRCYRACPERAISMIKEYAGV